MRAEYLVNQGVNAECLAQTEEESHQKLVATQINDSQAPQHILQQPAGYSSDMLGRSPQ